VAEEVGKNRRTLKAVHEWALGQTRGSRDKECVPEDHSTFLRVVRAGQLGLLDHPSPPKDRYRL